MSLDPTATLRFALERDRRFALWVDSSGGTVAGLAEWRGRAVAMAPEAERQRLTELVATAGAPELPSWAVRMLAALGAPCRFDSLSEAYARRALPVGDTERTRPIPIPGATSPSFATLAAWVDRTLDAPARAALETSLAADPELAHRARDLAALAQRLAPRDLKRRPSGPLAPGSAGTAAAPPTPTAPTAPTAPAAAPKAEIPAAGSPRSGWLWPVLGLVVAIAILLVVLGLRGRRSTVADAGAPAEAGAPVREVVLVDGGHRILATESGEVAGLPGLSGALERRIARALLEGELPPVGTLLVGLEAAPATAASSAEPPVAELVAPVATRVLAERPTFRVAGGAEARSIRIRVLDLSGTLLTESGELALPAQWQPPRALPRGRVLAWQVEARRRDGQRALVPDTFARSPRFLLATPDDVAWAEREVAAASGSRLVAAIVAAELGALDDAEAALAALAAENPGSAVVTRLQSSLARRR